MLGIMQVMAMLSNVFQTIMPVKIVDYEILTHNTKCWYSITLAVKDSTMYIQVNSNRSAPR